MDDAPPLPRIFADSEAGRRDADLIRRFFDEVLAQGDPKRAERFLSPAFRDENPAPGQAADAAGVAAKLAALWSAFEDGRFELHEVVAAAGKVAARSTFRGTQTGAFGALAPTGRAVGVPFMDLYTVADGLICGHAHVFDSGEMMRQLTG